MSVGLIDWIFENLDIQNLDRKQVFEHLNYLKEIVKQESSLEQVLKYCSYKVMLENRLIQLDRKLVNTSISPGLR